MAFLALAAQKSCLNLQKNFLQLQLVSIDNQININSSRMEAIKEEYAGTDEDETDDPTYLYYEQLDEQFESEKDSLNSQLTVIDNEISSLKTLVNNNIKSSCTLNLASGG